MLKSQIHVINTYIAQKKRDLLIVLVDVHKIKKKMCLPQKPGLMVRKTAQNIVYFAPSLYMFFLGVINE